MAARALSYGLIFFLVLFQSHPAFALLPYLASETAVTVERGKSKLDLSLQDDRWNSRLSTYALKAEMTSGLINNLDFSVDVPYLFRNQKKVTDEDGLGDLTLKAKVRFIKGREATPVSIAGQLSVKFPSCNKDKMLSQECTGEPDVGIRAIASKEFFPVTVHLNLGYLFIGNPPDKRLNDIVVYSLAFDYLTVADHFHVVGELAGETHRYPKSTAGPMMTRSTSADPLSVLIGLLYDVDVNKALSLSSSFGLTEASPDYSLSVGFRYLF
ncbi:MAG: transporter [Nitrospirae bacterium]|nr:transporter [Nitrospirota bacterium]